MKNLVCLDCLAPLGDVEEYSIGRAQVGEACRVCGECEPSNGWLGRPERGRILRAVSDKVANDAHRLLVSGQSDAETLDFIEFTSA
jgi:NMD protein affecting ribosome stability and mRNA decay